MLYTIALFTHIVGVLGIFASVALEFVSLFGLRRSRLIEEVRAWTSLHRVISWAFPLATLLTLGAGLFMALNAWGWKVPWIDVSFFAFILMGLHGRFNARRHQQLHRALGDELSGPLPAELLPRLNDPILLASTLMMTTIGVGVVFLMTFKPGLLGSLIAFSVALITGLGAISVLRGAGQTRRQPKQDFPA